MAVFAFSCAEGLRDGVSRPRRIPRPKRAMVVKTFDPRATAPMATALFGSRPTIMVSTMDHAHPAELGEDERDGELDGGAKFVAKMGREGTWAKGS